MTFDIRISDHGTVVLLKPLTDSGQNWLDSLQEPRWFAGGVEVHPTRMNEHLKAMRAASVRFTTIF